MPREGCKGPCWRGQLTPNTTHGTVAGHWLYVSGFHPYSKTLSPWVVFPTRPLRSPTLACGCHPARKSLHWRRGSRVLLAIGSERLVRGGASPLGGPTHWGDSRAECGELRTSPEKISAQCPHAVLHGECCNPPLPKPTPRSLVPIPEATLQRYTGNPRVWSHVGRSLGTL